MVRIRKQGEGSALKGELVKKAVSLFQWKVVFESHKCVRDKIAIFKSWDESIRKKDRKV